MELSKEQIAYFQIIEDLHKNWKPHPGQVEAGKPVVNDNVRTLFLQNGRKWGKTEFAIYMLWRKCLLNPGSACYYVGPTMTHARKLIWTEPRLWQFGPERYLDSRNSTEMIVKFKNGSFIQVIGSENYAAANGLRPAMLVYDEFGEFVPEFHNVMNPNRIVLKSPLIVIGTPPAQGSINKEQYIALADECKTRKDCIWMRRTSYDNPHIDKAELDIEKENYFARGESHLWYTYYEALIVTGGSNVVFPMLKTTHVRPHDEIMAEIHRDIHNLEWYCTADPGTTTVMAALFVAINPYSKAFYILDEIYETKKDRTSVQVVMPSILDISHNLYRGSRFDEDWIKTADEAAAWFMTEVSAQYGYAFMPTLKMHHKKESGISLLKDMLANGVITISDRCINLYKEMSEYVTKTDGSFIKGRDHLIDALRYTLAAAQYTTVHVLHAAKQLGPRDAFSLAHGNEFRHLKPKYGEEVFDDSDWTDAAAVWEEKESW